MGGAPWELLADVRASRCADDRLGTRALIGRTRRDLPHTSPEVPLPAQSVMTTTLSRTITVAAGVFAPGHLGELTRYLPFELVDDVLAQTRTMQQRLRVLPSRTGVYFVLALGLFPRSAMPGSGRSCARVWPVPAWSCRRCQRRRCVSCVAGWARPR
jgi:Insertion element 4 transposase N-terminal